MTKNKAKILLVIMGIALILGIVFAFVPVSIGPVWEYHPYPTAIKLGLDLKGGVYAVYDVKPNEEDIETTDFDTFNATVEGTANSLENLLFGEGYSEAVVSFTTNANLTGQIRVEVPDVDDPDRIFELIEEPAKLEFKETADSDPVLTGSDHLDGASVVQHESGNGFAVALDFNNEGTQIFSEYTSAHTGQKFGIYVNGEVLMEPTIQDAITTGRATISPSGTAGGYEYDDAYALAIQIQAGCFALELTPSDNATITPLLGEGALTTALIADGVALILIIGVMIWWYRALGAAAGIALLFYTITFIFFLSIFPWVQLTLAGIAGILLSIGMAVDANVIIFERIKEERALNKPIPSCVKVGFRKSLSAIIDGNVTTLIGAVVMWIFGSSAIKGFAITLFIGIVLSMFFAIVGTRIVIKCFLPFNSASDKLYGLKSAKAIEAQAAKKAAKAEVK